LPAGIAFDAQIGDHLMLFMRLEQDGISGASRECRQIRNFGEIQGICNKKKQESFEDN
jgi:hypothetical protein